MSNVEANDQYDRRLGNPPERDGMKISLDHDECRKLHAILGEMQHGSGLDDAYKQLSRYLERFDERDTIRVWYAADMIQLEEV